MNRIFFVIPVIFFLILGSFFYLLVIDRNPSEIPSALLNKDVPKFEANELLSDKNLYQLMNFAMK